MQTKIFAPLLLLVVSMFFVSSCSKQESVPGTSGKQAQTKPRNAIGPPFDILEGAWYIRKIQTFDVDPREPWGEGIVTTTHYGKREYLIVFNPLDPLTRKGTGYRFGPPTGFKDINFKYRIEGLGDDEAVIADTPLERGKLLFNVTDISYIGGDHNRLRLTGVTWEDGNIRTIWDLDHPRIPLHDKGSDGGNSISK